MLVRLESSIFRAEVAQAKARLELSEANHKRASQLETLGAGTVRALDEASSLRIDRSAVELAETRLRKTEILAPFDGVLGLRRISVGKIVEPGEQIVNLEAIDTLKVDFRVPEIHLAAWRPDQGIEITIDAIPGLVFSGKVYAIDPQIEVAGRSIGAAIIRTQLNLNHNKPTMIWPSNRPGSAGGATVGEP
ncbi:MAG: efflux RND transporter periplasmic adaptor subunit [Rhodospirillales bacterium]|nr:efflux RND transporter periplasmic adaptor subunit [Rhodospirillales bacterium]